MSVVTLQIGQCGNQLGCSLFDALAADALAAAAPDGAGAAFFRDRGAGGRARWAARSVLIDMEPKVVDAAIARARGAAAASGWAYGAGRSLSGHSGSGNNWALGHHHFGPKVRDDALDLVRREVEAADWLEGFLLLQSVAGGTGAGLGTYLAEALADEFREGALFNVCVWPYEGGEVAVQPYNALLTLSHLADVSDGVLLLQNEVLHATCTKSMGIARPGFQDLNGVAARALAGALLPAYARPAEGAPPPPPPRPGQRGAPAAPAAAAAARQLGRVPLHPLGDLAAHLTPHPRFRLASVRHVPTLAPGTLDFTTFAWPPLLRRLRQMAITGSFLEEGMEWGPRSTAAAAPHAPGPPAHRYRNRAASSALFLRGSGAAEADAAEFADPRWHAAWAGDPLLVAASGARAGGCQMAATLLATDQAAVAPLARMRDAGYRMAGARAFLHQYEAHGLEEGALLAAFAGVEDALAAYAGLAATAGAAAAVASLLEAARGTERGVSTSPEARAKIMAAVEELKRAGAGKRTVEDASATWRLLWTTEKETLWIVKNAGLFGTKAGEVYQVIDVPAGRLQNVIEFPPDGAFIVDSSVYEEGAGGQRLGFKFGAAKVKLPKRDFGLPPFGQGWFDTVYVDDRLRVAQDIRGDTLVVERDGPPRIFS
ncbi:delta tubulin [Raphidocelis subcapitata]|uniref:Tubulin delta chain n=1 Tax=Raphidocelis subcapitata TaxID=307507 RepID=A0A2V0P1I6_9CHLO|nr:delta tubulin [Raphidocelis subcapitata]|eukprot:GBF91057.1 delta tubulin [Raphidocelis subcapitata]